LAALGDAGRGDSVANATHDLYRQYGKQIYAYCLHQLRSREEAEDAVQTTFLNAFRGLQRGTTTRFEQAWLYKIAQNVCIARRSSSGRRLRLEAPDDFEILQEVVPSGNGSGDTLELMGLDGALEKMPENQRRAILLREWQGLSYREIAAELSLSQGAVEMLIFRARRTLATALQQPVPVQRRRTGRVKTGFSFGSLVAALKGLFSGGAALKMAAVAVTATVAGTNAVVHSVVHRTARAQAQRAALRPLVVPAMTSARPATLIRASALVPTHAAHANAGVDAAVLGSVATTQARSAIVEDEAAPAPAAMPTQQEETAPSPAVEPVQSAPPQTGSPSSSDSSTTSSSDGQGSAKGSAGNSGSTTGKVRGTFAAHDGSHGPFSPPDPTTTETTTTTDPTSTTETTTTSSDDSTTTTDTEGTATGAGSSGSADDGGGHGQGHDNGNGGSSGNGGGNGHHAH
jgi:RNA polymerase sigma factor (sigma-70 family)